MSTNTTYYGFTKPAQGDPADLTTFNAMVDQIDTQMHTWAGIIGNVVNRVLYNYNTASYPARITGVTAGYIEYIGPVQPTDWLDGDTWVDNS